MKEKIYTIPVNEGFEADDECPFCAMERAVERSAIRYVAGPAASYMEPDLRAATDKAGFCREHIKELYDYGNTLGAALILQTHMAGIIEEFQAEAFQVPKKKGVFAKKAESDPNAYWKRLQARVGSCYICDKLEYNMERYFATFFYLIREEEFRKKVEHSKGFCLRHFARLMETAGEKLPGAQQEWFYATVFSLMEENLVRVKQDLDWLIAKYDYRNASAPWGNARDALPRAMEKLEGLHPADPPYRHE